MRSSIKIEPEIWSLFHSHETDVHPIFGEICLKVRERENCQDVEGRRGYTTREGKEGMEQRRKRRRDLFWYIPNKNQY